MTALLIIGGLLVALAIAGAVIFGVFCWAGAVQQDAQDAAGD